MRSALNSTTCLGELSGELYRNPWKSQQSASTCSCICNALKVLCNSGYIGNCRSFFREIMLLAGNLSADIGINKIINKCLKNLQKMDKQFSFSVSTRQLNFGNTLAPFQSVKNFIARNFRETDIKIGIYTKLQSLYLFCCSKCRLELLTSPFFLLTKFQNSF